MEATSYAPPSWSWAHPLVPCALVICSVIVIFLFSVARAEMRRVKARRRLASEARQQRAVADVADVPPPGQVVTRDDWARPASERRGEVGGRGTACGTRVLVWNIERGFRLRGVIDALRREDADVLLLQEVDVACARSGGVDVGAEVAAALGYTLVYGNEMDGVDEHKPVAYAADGDAHASPRRGSEGNAILTRLPLLEARPVALPCVRHRYKKRHDHLKRHCAVAARLRCRDGSELQCYSVHLDAFAGRVARAYQMLPVLADAAAAVRGGAAVVVGGDLNTHNHGAARLTRTYCGDDPYRFAELGRSEAAWWKEVVLVTGVAGGDEEGGRGATGGGDAEDGGENTSASRPTRRRPAAATRGHSRGSSAGGARSQGDEAASHRARVDALFAHLAAIHQGRGDDPEAKWQQLLAARVLNPAQLADPFDAEEDVTQRIGAGYTVPGLGWALPPVYRAKLDWMLLSPRVRATRMRVSQHLKTDYANAPSDHEYLVADLSV